MRTITAQVAARNATVNPARMAASAATGWENVLGPIVLLTKVMLVAFLMFWVRFTYPRLREDQLQAVAWKFLIPIGLANILITGALKVAF